MRYLIMVSSIAFISLAQNLSSPAGSWSAEFKGAKFVRLELRSEDGRLRGTLAISDLQVDDQGGVRSVGELPRDATPIFDVSQQGSTVTFSRKDGDDTDRFEFRLLDDARGELRVLPTDELRAELAENGIAAPAPFLLTRQTSKF